MEVDNFAYDSPIERSDEIMPKQYKNADTSPQDIEEFKESMYKMQNARKEILKALLDTGEFDPSYFHDLDYTLKELCDERTQENERRISTRGVEFMIFIEDEIKGLQKDQEILSLLRKNDNDSSLMEKLLPMRLQGILSKYSKMPEQQFLEEVEECERFLLNLIDTSSTDGVKPMFITDWDGTMKDYCSQYATNLQPVYSALMMGQFAKVFTRLSAVLTAGPLKKLGILDLTSLPVNGPVLFSGSWGREWWLNGRRVVHDEGVPEEGRVALDELQEQLSELYSGGEFVQFELVGSGVQRKVDRLTLGVQTVLRYVPEDLSERYVDAVKERIHRVDPSGRYLVLKDEHGTDLEICVHSSGTVWNKGDGVSTLVETLGDSLNVGKVLVAGDTSSDLPMLQRTAEENPENVYGLFVAPDEKLKEMARNIVQDEKRICFISCPDIAHCAFFNIICNNYRKECCEK